MKILVADKISPNGVAWLRQQPGLDGDRSVWLARRRSCSSWSKDVQAIAVRSETKITAEVLAAAPLLKVVGRAGVGVDNVDVEAATERGVIVMNTPSGNTVATAELTFTHILCGARPVPQAAASMRAGQWDRKSFSGLELFRKTLGIVGLGRIGGEVAKRAQAFGMRVLANDPYLAPSRAKAMQVEAVSLDELLAQSDYITVHMPLTDDTHYMIDEAAFAKTKKGVRIFNCARGGIIKEAALLAALKSGQVAAAGLDVYEDEPLAADSELRKLPNVILTPHLGASTAEAQDAVGVEIAEQIADVLAGGVIRNAVNMPSIDAGGPEGPRTVPRPGREARHPGPADRPARRSPRCASPTGARSSTSTPIRSPARSSAGSCAGSAARRSISSTPRSCSSAWASRSRWSNPTTDSDYTDLIAVEAAPPAGAAISARARSPARATSRASSGSTAARSRSPPRASCSSWRTSTSPAWSAPSARILGRDGVNIADMSLSRLTPGGTAYMVVRVDTEPGEAARAEIKGNPAIKLAKFVQL